MTRKDVVMFRFPNKPKWYQMAAKVESEFSDLSAGPSGLSNHFLKNETSIDVKDIRQVRKLEGYAILLRKLRVSRSLTIEKLAAKINVDPGELILLESRAGFKASLRTISLLAEFYEIPLKKLLQLSGAAKDLDEETEDAVIRFAADSESFERLSRDEKKSLNHLVKILSDK